MLLAYVLQAYGKERGRHLMGIFYGGHGQLLLCQFIAVVVVIAWVVFWSYLFFTTLNKVGLIWDYSAGLVLATTILQYSTIRLP